MFKYQVNFYDLSVWIVEGNSSLHVRKKAREYYPDRFVVSVIQIPGECHD